ncbi:hypothetical protein D0C36_03200 [Mucilaginibacter conchicola]|uniref:Uncharacterized protein n=1 Tax=Mucilaginibacter conchicola TaxID=2303333 RepID=A0A372NWT4_9SPHI|nr:hypothetical protein [Mucilaginibacter conchicola]RFZ94568.1 hypothetical protein D0C36_03200 [Mucilaginibacter conchicola]
MKKLFLLSLLAISTIATNAVAASKVMKVKSNSSFATSKITFKENINQKPRYFVFEDNGKLWLLTIYDNGNAELTYIGTPIVT